MKIAIIGTGYVGLVTGCCLASRGHEVTCVDKQQSIIDRLKRGDAPFFEPGLNELLKDVIGRGLFSPTTELNAAVRQSKVVLITVGTPPGPDGIDLSGIRRAAREVGQAIRDADDYKVVVVKSTVTPGTSEDVVEAEILKVLEGSRTRFGIAMNPEFLREGAAVADFMNPDRIVIGCREGQESEAVLREMYSSFPAQIVVANIKTAEMIKYASNSFFSLLISFSNEMANICELTPGVDVQSVLRGLILDNRFSTGNGQREMPPGLVSYLSAGCGFGGSCFPKDIAAIVEYSKERAYSPKMLQSILDINQDRPIRLVRVLQKELGSLEKRKVAVLGLAFKPGTDDMRESPSITLIDALLKSGASILAYDPVAIPNAKEIWKTNDGIEWMSSAEAALKGADAVVVMTSWDEFRTISAETYRRLMKNPIVVDGRRIYDPEKFKAVKYHPIGFTNVQVAQ